MKYVQKEFKSFQNPFHFKWKKSYFLHSRGLWWIKIWIHWESKMQSESLGKSFHSLSLTFSKSFKFHSVSHNQSLTIKQINQSYLFNITFQNLEFWDVTTMNINIMEAMLILFQLHAWTCAKSSHSNRSKEDTTLPYHITTILIACWHTRQTIINS